MLTCYTWAMGLIIVIQHLFGMIPAGSKSWPLDVRIRIEFCCRTGLVCAAVLCSPSYDNSVKTVPVLGNNSPEKHRKSYCRQLHEQISLRTVLFSELVLNKQGDFKWALKEDIIALMTRCASGHEKPLIYRNRSLWYIRPHLYETKLTTALYFPPGFFFGFSTGPQIPAEVFEHV